MKGAVLAVFATLLALSSAADEICLGVPDGSYVRGRYTCQDFYFCASGNAYFQSCPPGLWFSLEQQACVPPEESDCEYEQIPGLPEPPMPEPNPECEEVENFSYLAAQDSCQFYYQCIDGYSYRLSCPKGYWFNFEFQRCGNRYEFSCDLELSTPSPPMPPPSPCAGIQNFGLVPNIYHCYAFYMCIMDRHFPMTCEGNLWFDRATHTCRDPAEAECIQAGPPPPLPPSPNICENVADGQKELHYRFCNEYFECENQVGTPHICSEGLWFDEDAQDCVAPIDAFCPHGGQPGGPPVPNICIGADDGTLMPSEVNCQTYYVCANDVAYRLHCAQGQFFDREELRCAPMNEVVCPV
ncbi:peritrophin-48-like [Uranotaenia lowii]|uniref:peritrophin-48-like n=1 Tax=Uranotaenia lowii TaxID=190385 RepID=UPI00247A1270|nr:peritrophin-48-like [Uranotaenia lowii]